MQIDITHQPSYAHLIVKLAAGESIMAEPGAMVSHSPSVSIETGASGDGILSTASSMLGGESAFVNEFTTEDESGTVTLSPPTPGDIHHHELNKETLYAVDGAYLASDPDIDIESDFGGVESILSGAGLTPLTLSGTGNVFIETFGGIEAVELDQGESYVVDNDHVVAWEGGIEFDARRVGGLKSTLLSGEGLVLDFTGPGTVWYQTRGLDVFADSIAQAMPSSDEDDSGGFNIGF